MFVSANFVKLAQKRRVEIGQYVGFVWRFSTIFPFFSVTAQDSLCDVLAFGYASAPDRRQNALCGFVASVEGKSVRDCKRLGIKSPGTVAGAGRICLGSGGRFVTLGKMEPAEAKKQIGNTDEETKFCLLFVCHVSPSFHAAEVSSALWKSAAASWALSRAARRVASIMWARRVSSASSSMPGRV